MRGMSVVGLFAGTRILIAVKLSQMVHRRTRNGPAKKQKPSYYKRSNKVCKME